MRTQRSWTTALVVAVIALTSGGWLMNQGVASGVVESRQLLEQVHRLVADRFVDEVSPDELYQMAIDGMLEKLGDPYTDFLSAEDWEALRYSTTGNYGGLGVRIDSKDGWITVVQVLPGGPAERLGMAIGDRIIEVEGESAEGWTQEKAVSVLRGPKGEPVNITVARIGVERPLRFEVIRDIIQVAQAQGFLLDDGIGFVTLRGFSRPAQGELIETVDRLRDEGARGLILDLRYNPGGLLEEGIEVTNLFLDRGEAIVETRSRLADQNYTYRAPAQQRYPDIPLVVLVNQWSASASEIVAGALQDHDRAVIVGTTTYGKGSVQTLYGLPGDHHIKITTARWYTPVGRSIQKEFDRDQAMQDLVATAVSVSGEPVGAPIEEEEREPFETDSGRTVYGGGGITPDLIVFADTLNTDEQQLRRRAMGAGVIPQDVVFRWSVEWAKDHEVREGFEVTDAMREAVFARLEQADADIDRELYEKSLRYVDYLIATEVAGSAFGEIPQLKSRSERDGVVAAALELLRGADTPSSLIAAATREAEARAAADSGEDQN